MARSGRVAHHPRDRRRAGTGGWNIEMRVGHARAPRIRHALGALLAALFIAGVPASAAADDRSFGRVEASAIADGGATTVIVKYRDGTSSSRRTAARDRAHATRVRNRPERRREVVRPAAGRSVAETVRTLRADPAVEYAEPNYPVRFAASPSTEPFRTNYQWGLENAGSGCVPGYGISCANDVDIDAVPAWGVSQGAGVTVAVADDGLDFTHPDLTTQGWSNPDDGTHGINLCAAAGPQTELHGAGEDFHGTAVASVIAAATNDTGIAGVAPDARVMAVRWLVESKGCDDTDMGAAAIEWAVDHGADVINASWGSEMSTNTLLDAVHYAEAADVLIVAAAGNAPGITFYPARYETSNVLSVAAVSPSGYLPSWSNRGSWIDMAAPGEWILAACRDYPPEKLACADPWVYFDGTSFAAPHVAGVAAQLLALQPALRDDVAALRSKLINSGVKSPKLDDGLTGSGRRLNAAYALDVTPPAAPEVGVRAKLGSTIGATSTSMAIAWPAVADATGIESYRVRYRKAGTSTWTTVTNATTSLSVTTTLAYDQPYEVQVTARDRGANTTTTSVTATPKRYTESSSLATYTGSWSLVQSTKYQGGKARATTTAGRKARYEFAGRSFAWVAATGPTRGSANVWVDGVKVASVSLYSSSASYRKVVWAKSWPSSGPHAVTVVVTGTIGHPRVDVDAAIIAK
jgi:subtilisin family serine protease